MFKHLSVTELKTKPLTDFTIVDIRDPASFASGSIEGAQLLNNQNIDQFIASADFTKPLVVCCYHGNSSQGAADYLSEQGFAEVFSLDGGYAAWSQTN
ncbi:thiosulfate sulfurtransferase GlpE [Marinicellulosiphila megalodicopiae]|uniref:thiosulfate sulfurtransferase GlpE n=1 Tax=Marinicellulosiphila megalodicopiae TaxID=2724896 RepID=UPI003BAE7D09